MEKERNEEEFIDEVLDSMKRFEELERETKKIVEEKKKLKEKHHKITQTWNKYFQKSMELNAEIFMDFKQELNHILDIQDKKIIDQEIADREEREFKRIEQAIKQIENLETKRDKEYDKEEDEKYIYKNHRQSQ